MPCGCPVTPKENAILVDVSCNFPALPDDVPLGVSALQSERSGLRKALGVDEDDWNATKKIISNGQMQLLLAYLLLAVILVAILLPVTLLTELHGLWGCMGLVNAARLSLHWIYPTAVKKMRPGGER